MLKKRLNLRDFPSLFRGGIRGIGEANEENLGGSWEDHMDVGGVFGGGEGPQGCRGQKRELLEFE